MSKSQLLYCVTDKELYDMLMASKQRITESTLLEIARERGIFCSPREARESLVDYLSLLPYSHDGLEAILGHRANTQRTEKRTSITLNAALTVEDIKTVCNQYREQAAAGEQVNNRQEGTNKYTATVNYSELDYSKTRLLQRRQKEAEIEFFIKDKQTIIRMPANSKALSVVDSITHALEARAKSAISTEAIELAHLKTPDARSQFFTSLISSIPGYKLETVTDIKVESKLHEHFRDEDTDDVEDDENSLEDKIAERKMLSVVVENIALKGQGLLSAPEYQQLKEKGFFITNIVWKSRQANSPFNIIEFDAGFTEPREGRGFKYNVRGVYRNINGTHTSTIRQVSKDEKPPYFDLLEQTARRVLRKLTDELDSSTVETNES